MTSFDRIGRAVALTAICLLAAPALAAEREVPLAAQEGVALTVYNADLALVSDRRRIELTAGEAAYAFVDVSARIRPETVDFALLDDAAAAVRVVEQYFAYDLLSPQRLLEESLGERITVIRTNPATGEEVVEAGEVLSTNGGLVLRIGDRVETLEAGGAPYRYRFDRVPDNLRARPTLVLTLDSPTAAAPSSVLRYLTNGLSWTADYAAELSPDETAMSLKGWVTVANNSGTDYRDARLQLVAGDVNVVQQRMAPAAPMMEMVMAAAPKRGQDMAAEGLVDFHLYTVARATTLRDRQTKQVALLTAAAVPVQKDYIARGGGHYYRARVGPFKRQNVGVWLEFDNEKAGGLGRPLPAGVVRVYKHDSSGGAQFAGEDAIGHTPDGDTVRLQMGRAFDVTIDRRQTDYRDNRSRRETYWQFETSHEIVVRNARDEAVEVKIEEPMPGDWTVTAESLAHVKQDAATALWTVPVPAKGETTLTYSVRVVLPR